MINQGVNAPWIARDSSRIKRAHPSLIAIHSGWGLSGDLIRVARECTYQDFMKCKPLYFKGTEGVVELTQWKEPCHGGIPNVMTVTHDVAYSMTWVNLKKKMTDKYCPRNEMKKLEAELWNLKVIGNANQPLTQQEGQRDRRQKKLTCFEVRSSVDTSRRIVTRLEKQPKANLVQSSWDKVLQQRV
ncbi:hypothetical protein Tco_0409720 [Tanacetum coccineum]